MRIQLARWLVAVAFGVIAPGRAEASIIINVPDIAGYGVFEDTSTSLVWLDLDNFSGKSYNEMAAAAIAAGFTVATRAELDPLLASLPLPNAATWDSYAAIMGQSPTRPVIFGSYGPVSPENVVGFSYAFRGDTAWTYFDNTVGAPTKFPDWPADMNIWAFRASPTTGDEVPEPASLMLIGSGLVTLVAARRRQRARK